MRKLLYIFLFCTPLSVATYSQAPLGYCSKRAPKISFSGKAPWAIDGNIKDWKTILGEYTGDNDMPFIPPVTSAFNWVNDLYFFTPDPDMPKPENDMRFLSFTHDDYNVYFYLRRRVNGSSPNTFYYFFDVNADAVMNLGEPVIHASFTNKAISALTLGLYIPDNDSNYSQQKKGNLMMGEYPPADYLSVNKYPMTGDVFDLFNTEFLFFPVKLGKNEIFKAALTEDGYGLEMAIPWRYLKNWLSLKHPLDPGNIFFYKVSMQEGKGRYNRAKVVDNAGSCFGALGISGNVNLDKSLTTTTLVPGSTYRFKLAYTNITNAATEIGLEQVNLKFTPDPALPLTTNDFLMTAYRDNNCNGAVDNGEAALKYEAYNFGDIPGDFTFRSREYNALVMVLPPSGKGCYLVDLTLPAGAVTKFKISFSPSVTFVEGREICEPGCGSKPINIIGFMETEIGGDLLTTSSQKYGMLQEARTHSEVVLYPNPSRGITNLVLPQSADISIVDNLGRSIQTINSAKSGIIELRNLKAGLYIVKIRIAETGKVITKKLVIQP